MLKIEHSVIQLLLKPHSTVSNCWEDLLKIQKYIVINVNNSNNHINVFIFFMVFVFLYP